MTELEVFQFDYGSKPIVHDTYLRVAKDSEEHQVNFQLSLFLRLV